MSNVIVSSADAVTSIIETSSSTTVLETKVEPTVIETAAKQGPPGKNGTDGSAVSKKEKNRITKETDGLYVSDDLTPDPLAYYILAKN